MLEKAVEAKIVKFCKAEEIITIKLGGTHNRGKPDRLCLKNGVIVFLEVKRSDGKGKVSALQQKWIDDLLGIGIPAFVVDNPYKAEAILKKHLCLAVVPFKKKVLKAVLKVIIKLLGLKIPKEEKHIALEMLAFMLLRFSRWKK